MIEAPVFGLEFWGNATLEGGKAVIDLDATSRLTPGTFEALTQRAVVTGVNNLDGFARLRAGRIEGAQFTIHCEDEVCTDEVSWLVKAERADPFIKFADYADPETGRLVPEQEKPE